MRQAEKSLSPNATERVHARHNAHPQRLDSLQCIRELMRRFPQDVCIPATLDNVPISLHARQQRQLRHMSSLPVTQQQLLMGRLTS